MWGRIHNDQFFRPIPYEIGNQGTLEKLWEHDRNSLNDGGTYTNFVMLGYLPCQQIVEPWWSLTDSKQCNDVKHHWPDCRSLMFSFTFLHVALLSSCLWTALDLHHETFFITAYYVVITFGDFDMLDVRKTRRKQDEMKVKGCLIWRRRAWRKIYRSPTLYLCSHINCCHHGWG